MPHLHLDKGKLSAAAYRLSNAAQTAKPIDIFMAVTFLYMETISNWTGSVNTAEQVKKQITARWGSDEADNYDPKSNCLTFAAWLKAGYAVRKGEKAIKSFIVLEEKDKDNKVIRKHFKRISLFYIRQVDKIE